MDDENEPQSGRPQRPPARTEQLRIVGAEEAGALMGQANRGGPEAAGASGPGTRAPTTVAGLGRDDGPRPTATTRRRRPSSMMTSMTTSRTSSRAAADRARLRVDPRRAVVVPRRDGRGGRPVRRRDPRRARRRVLGPLRPGCPRRRPRGAAASLRRCRRHADDDNSAWLSSLSEPDHGPDQRDETDPNRFGTVPVVPVESGDPTSPRRRAWRCRTGPSRPPGRCPRCSGGRGRRDDDSWSTFVRRRAGGTRPPGGTPRTTPTSPIWPTTCPARVPSTRATARARRVLLLRRPRTGRPPPAAASRSTTLSRAGRRPQSAQAGRAHGDPPGVGTGGTPAEAAKDSCPRPPVAAAATWASPSGSASRSASSPSCCCAAGPVRRWCSSPPWSASPRPSCFAAARRVGFHPATLLGLAASAALPLAVYWRGEAGLPAGAVPRRRLHPALVPPRRRHRAPPAQTSGVTVLAIGLRRRARLLRRAHPAQGSPLGVSTLLAIILPTVAADVGGFFVGRTSGARRCQPVSPNKTVEGLAGGMAAAVVRLGPVRPLHPRLRPVQRPVGLGLVFGVVIAPSPPRSATCASRCSSATSASRTWARSSPATAACSTASTRCCSCCPPRTTSALVVGISCTRSTCR